MYPLFFRVFSHIGYYRILGRAPVIQVLIIVRKMWYIHTMDYYLAINKNEIMTFATTWRKDMY